MSLVPCSAPPTLDGLTRRLPSRGGIEWTAEPEADIASFCHFLDWLPIGCELTFYDPHYPTMSDPRAFVAVQWRPIQKTGERWLYHSLGNHGWRSSWRLQSCEMMVAYLAATQIPTSELFGQPQSIVVRLAIDPSLDSRVPNLEWW